MADSLTHKTMSYALDQWPGLAVYCKDGSLKISNAAAEDAIRPSTIWLEKLALCLYTERCKGQSCITDLIESAKVNWLEPYGYLCNVLKHLP